MPKNGAPEDLDQKAILKAAKARTWKEAVVKIGYADVFGLEEGVNDFWVKLSDPAMIADLFEQIGEYNAFDGPFVAAMMVDLIGSGIVMYIEFGRRGSPELHVFVRQPELFKSRVYEALTMLRPSELDEYGPYGIRAWWD